LLRILSVRTGLRLLSASPKNHAAGPGNTRAGGVVPSLPRPPCTAPLPSSTRTSLDTQYAKPRAQQIQDAFEERLKDNTITPVPDQAAFRIDFPSWLQTLTERERRIIRAMLRNELTKNLSRKFQVSPARISQLRREFELGWNRFVADAEQTMAMA
jgi:hypothetical protein